ILFDPTKLIVGVNPEQDFGTDNASVGSGDTIPNLTTSGADVTLTADESIEIDGYINTRKVAQGADPTNDAVASTGNSGKITLNAPSITVNSGGVLDASANSGFTAGDITLSAYSNPTSSLTLSTNIGNTSASSSITVNGTITGGNITL